MSIALTAAVVAGLTLVGAAPAQADGEILTNQEEYIFNNPRGSSWTVPGGVSVVYVGLRGGDGGNAGRTALGAIGDNMVVRVPVTPGQRLTLHAGKAATGKTSDQRDGGLGYVDGGSGGKGSLDGKNGGGGGGAAAILLDGKVMAVAAGGGGHGGNGGSGDGHGDGGLGGGITYPMTGWQRGPGGKGGGSHAGAGGGVEFVNPPAVKQNGSDAANLSAAGGGGGSGAGWPSGAAGSGGTRAGLLTSNGGGGGGAPGVSYVRETATRVPSAERLPESKFYRGPVAEKGTVKVVVPRRIALNDPFPSEVNANVARPIATITPRIASGWSAGRVVAGTVTVIIDDLWSRAYTSKGTFVLDSAGKPTYDTSSLGLPRFSEGTHTVKVRYTSPQRSGDYGYPEESTMKTITVRALPPIGGTAILPPTVLAGNSVNLDVSGLTPAVTETDVSVQWYLNGVRIPGARGIRYVPASEDLNKELSARVTTPLAFGYIDTAPATIEGDPGTWERYFADQMAAMPNPVETLEDANEVAAATGSYELLTQIEKDSLLRADAKIFTRLKAAQRQAQQVNQGFVGSAVSATSTELADAWHLRVVYTPRTEAGNSAVFDEVHAALARNGQMPVALYDISFVDTLTGEPWEPTAPVTVTFLNDDVTGLDKPTVVHRLSDGSLETVRSKITNGRVSFVGSSFSVYGIAAVPKQPVTEPDSDGDGIPNTEDPDIDGDGIPNGQDDDVDGDGVANADDGDVDGDGVPNGRDPDVDGDGIPNGQDDDIDGDGILNAQDDDMDGDGIPNALDPDENGDGVSEVTDPAPNVDVPDASDNDNDAGAADSGPTDAKPGVDTLAATGQTIQPAVWIGGGVLLLLGAGVMFWNARARKRRGAGAGAESERPVG